MIEEQTPPTAGLGQKRRFGPRPATVRFTLHCRHAAALPRTGGLGQLQTLILAARGSTGPEPDILWTQKMY